ncbi:MAG TPA: hypothetical protein PLP76_09755 [Bacteroidales bacterium]|nr:hypothetical protein [Bacteroidales bacterium]HPJ92194.1 hypothetical protein [Bacteroidales bacterium]
MRLKINIPDVSIILAVASITLYIVFRNMGREFGSFAYLWAPLAMVSIFLSRPLTFIKGPLKFLLIYGILIVGILQYTLWKYMDDWNQVRIFWEFYFLIVMSLILYYYVSKNELIKLAWISKYAFIFVLIALITTNIALFIDPYLIRNSANSEMFTAFSRRLYNVFGVLSYSYSQAIICLIPIIVYGIKFNKKIIFNKKTLIFILFLIIITQIRSQIFGNILVMIVITFLSFVKVKRRFFFMVLMSVFVVIFIAIPDMYYVNFLYYLSTYFDSRSELYYKITDLAEFIKYPMFDTKTGAGGRAERYPLLFEALLANPFFGNASYVSLYKIELGAHLYWMNRLALWGVLGFAFFVFVLYKLYTHIESLFDKDFKFFYFLSWAAFIFHGLIKATGDKEIWLMLIVVIPGLYFYPLFNKKEENITVNNQYK